MTVESRHLIAALHNVLSMLELPHAPGCDEESTADLKRILRQRIQDLEIFAAIPPRLAITAKNPKALD